MSIDTSKQTVYVVQAVVPNDRIITTKQTCYVVLSPGSNRIHQVALEVIEDINPVNSETLKLCLPFDATVGESLTLDGSPSRHPMDLTTGGLPTIDGTIKQFGTGALDIRNRGYDVSTAVFNSISFDQSALETFPTFLSFSKDGTKMYTGGHVNETVFEWTLSPAWDITSAIDSGNSLDIEPELGDNNIAAIALSDDGTKLYAVGPTGSTVYQYTLPTPFSLSGSSYSTRSFSVSTQETAPDSVFVRDNGTKLYIVGHTSDTMYQYTITSGNVDTAIYDNVSLDVSPEMSPGGSGLANGLFFKPDGTRFFISGDSLVGDRDQVWQYNLTTAWDLSTASYSNLRFVTTTQGTSLSGVHFKSDGTRMYLIDPTNNTVFEYSIGSATFARALLPQPDFNFLADFTIEFWVYRNEATDGTVMGQWPSVADKAWRIRFNGTALDFEWTSDGSTVNTESVSFTVLIATWTHLAFENFGGIFTVYIDGLAKLSVPTITPIHASNADLVLGNSLTDSWDGLIDELKITVGEAIFQAPFVKPIASVACASIVTPPVVTWTPGNLGEQDECTDSEFTIIITGLETVLGTQTLQATGLPAGMVIDNFGNIIGVLPVHTAPPTVMEYFFQVTLYDSDVPILGPDTFSFDVRDLYLNDILQVTLPALYEPEDRTLWKQHLFALIPNDNIYRITDPAFGITLTPDLFIIDGLTEDDLTAFVTALSREDGRGPAKHELIIKTLSFGTTPTADVLFYTIEDPGSDILSFPNPLGPLGTAEIPITISPDPIEPASIDNVRDQLISAVGFDSQFGAEKIPNFLGGTYQPVLIAAFVSKGSGQGIVDKFNADAVHHVFKGRVILLDRINLKRCSTVWDENGGATILVKFDDI